MESKIENQEISNIGLAENQKRSKNRLMYLMTGVFILVSLIVGVLYYQNIKAEEKQKEAYKAKLNLAVSTMVESGSKAEYMINEYTNVWSGAISGKYGISNKLHDKYVFGFNDALKIQYDFFDEMYYLNNLKESRDKADSIMKDLANPPQEYKDAYETVVSMYGYYGEYEKLAEKPEGSYQSYTTKTRDLSSQFTKKVNEFKIRMP